MRTIFASTVLDKNQKQQQQLNFEQTLKIAAPRLHLILTQDEVDHRQSNSCIVSEAWRAPYGPMLCTLIITRHQNLGAG